MAAGRDRGRRPGASADGNEGSRGRIANGVARRTGEKQAAAGKAARPGRTGGPGGGGGQGAKDVFGKECTWTGVCVLREWMRACQFGSTTTTMTTTMTTVVGAGRD